MKKNLSKLVIPTVMAFSISANAAELPNRGRVDLTLDIDSLNLPQGQLDFQSTVDMINQLLNKKGVLADESSKVWVRGEGKKVELNCFDCLIIDSDNNLYNERPINKADRGGGSF